MTERAAKSLMIQFKSSVGLGSSNSAGDGHTDHRVVAGTDQTHHLDVSRDGGGASELGITVVFVTHDQEEAMALSHRIVVMNKGKFEQVGTPTEVYDNPATKYVASFIGEMNFIEKDGKTIAVRPEDVAITSEPADIQGCVRTIMVLGHYVEVNVQCGDLVVKCFVDRDQSERLTPGDPVNLKFLKTHIF